MEDRVVIVRLEQKGISGRRRSRNGGILTPLLIWVCHGGEDDIDWRVGRGILARGFSRIISTTTLMNEKREDGILMMAKTCGKPEGGFRG